MRHRNWCFTDYDKTEPTFSENMKYLCYQQEKCPTTGRLHWQSYVEMKESKDLQFMKQITKGHLEPRKGTQTQAIEYCCKIDGSEVKDTFKQFGTKGRQGTRTDLDSLVESIEGGATMKEILVEFRGNALRHLGMVERGLVAYHNMSSIDRYILEERERKTEAEKAEHLKRLTEVKVIENPEVTGNTGLSLEMKILRKKHGFGGHGTNGRKKK